jgi:thiosulfate reductase cytochrome b subunit
VASGKPSCGETTTTGARASKPRALVVRRHHLLVRVSHWLTIPLLLGLILSGLSIYWASPIYQHAPNPTTGNFDYFADAGTWICAHIPWLHHYADPANWVYNHGSLGPFNLAFALRFHWLCAYLLMLNGLVYLAGLCLGGGWRSLLPRLSDSRGVLQMTRYYLNLPYTILARRRSIHPTFRTKYNPLQRLAYFAVPLAGFLSVATGWAIHKPAQLVSIDLATAQHPQTLLATHLNGKPLTVEHGAPLRLLVPMKLGLKNIKAITRIGYTKDEPPDYWAKRGYSRYDGI